MALQMGELEVKVKANLDDLRQELAGFEAEDKNIEINADVNVDTSEIDEVEDGEYSAAIAVSADTKTAEADIDTLEAGDYNGELSLAGKLAEGFQESVQNLLNSTAFKIVASSVEFAGQVLSTAIDIGSAVWNFTLTAALDVDDKATLATISGYTLQQVNTLSYMSEQIDVSLDTWSTGLRSIKTDLETYSSDNEKWLESTQYQALGGKYDTAQAAWSELGAAGIQQEYIRYIASQSEDMWESLATTLLGTRGSSFMPAIQAMANGTYDELYAKYGANYGLYGMANSEETQNALLALSDSYANFESAIQAISKIVAAIAAPAFTTALDGITGFLEDVGLIIDNDELTNEEKGEKITEAFQTRLSEIWTGISDWFNNTFMPLFGDLFETLGSALSVLVNKLLYQIRDNLPDVVKDLLGLGYDGLKVQGTTGWQSMYSGAKLTELSTEEKDYNIANVVAQVMEQYQGIGLDENQVYTLIHSWFYGENGYSNNMTEEQLLAQVENYDWTAMSTALPEIDTNAATVAEWVTKINADSMVTDEEINQLLNVLNEISEKTGQYYAINVNATDTEVEITKKHTKTGNTIAREVLKH